MRRTIVVFVVLAAGAAALAQSRPGALTIDALLDIRHPSRGTWSPDGRSVAFVWDRGGVQNVFVVALDRPGTAPRALTRFETGLIDGLFWSAAGDRVLFGRDGDLWQASADGVDPRPLWTTEAVESAFAVSRDATTVAFARDGDLFVRKLGDGREVRLTSTADIESGPVWSPDGARLAFTAVRTASRTEAPSYSGAKILYGYAEREPGDVGVVPAAGGAAVMIGQTAANESAPRWIDRTRLVLQRISTDYRTREILTADATAGTARTCTRTSMRNSGA